MQSHPPWPGRGPMYTFAHIHVHIRVICSSTPTGLTAPQCLQSLCQCGCRVCFLFKNKFRLSHKVTRLPE